MPLLPGCAPPLCRSPSRSLRPGLPRTMSRCGSSRAAAAPPPEITEKDSGGLANLHQALSPAHPQYNFFGTNACAGSPSGSSSNGCMTNSGAGTSSLVTCTTGNAYTTANFATTTCTGRVKRRAPKATCRGHGGLTPPPPLANRPSTVGTPGSYPTTCQPISGSAPFPYATITCVSGAFTAPTGMTRAMVRPPALSPHSSACCPSPTLSRSTTWQTRSRALSALPTCSRVPRRTPWACVFPGTVPRRWLHVAPRRLYSRCMRVLRARARQP